MRHADHQPRSPAEWEQWIRTTRHAIRNIDHTAVMDRVRRRVGDKKVLALVKAFLKSGVMTE